MAENEGVRTTGEAIVKNIGPDVCKTPPSMAPVPYEIIGKFSDGIRYSTTVSMTSLQTITTNSRLPKVYGDEAGTGGGVVSGVNIGYCRAITYSSTVRAQGHNIVYHSAEYWMNCSGPDGPGNTTGRVIYVENIEAVYIGPLGTIEGSTNPTPKPETKEEKSWWETGLDWVHTGLDVIGLIPVVGEIADGANAVIHLAEAGVYAATGNNAKAAENLAMGALSAAAMWPAGGQAATGAKFAIKAGKEVLEEGAEKLVKEGIEEVVEKAAKEGVEAGVEKATKEGVEKAAKESAETGVEVTTKSKKIPCFPAGTPIHTPYGLVAIESLRAGDLVYSYDSTRRSVVESPVLRAFKGATRLLAELSLDSRVIRSTARHRFWSDDAEDWIDAYQLSRGTTVRCRDGSLRSIRNVQLCDVSLCETFNISVHNNANYFVGDDGILVHNEGDPPKGKIYIGYDSNGKPVYVGQTRQEIDARQKQHWNDAKKYPDKYGFKKDMTIKEVPGMNGLTDAEMDYHERRIYDDLKAQGHDLKNRQIPLVDEKYTKLIEDNC